ncbi:Cu(I)-responsive transcriptional regulator [Amphritea japonica]|uniref:MerR family transcriptional regulator, copper efflux regulator n=1 Tax=Amphritea japonica ATCC BAA-1530 TaxID=1278309 RepID=A0A7R6P743_9GAMM|nr:Cu(I)-responsive transcriptional regulator [Amphritea japonica]BBB24667.1 MerR family transcriptional regulator, copper efflux regulator [Amphritea japonica ATCC BAA-1530]
MNISQAAAAAGLTSKTIRFYEQQGVIPAAARSANGYRIYTEQQVDMLRFIRRSRDMGFSLDESRELLQLSLDPQRTSASVKQKAEQQIKRIDQQLESLQQMRSLLEAVARECRGDDSADCPILDQLNGVAVDNDSQE